MTLNDLILLGASIPTLFITVYGAKFIIDSLSKLFTKTKTQIPDESRERNEIITSTK